MVLTVYLRWERSPVYVFDDRIILFEWVPYTIYSTGLENLTIPEMNEKYVKHSIVELDNDKKLKSSSSYSEIIWV